MRVLVSLAVHEDPKVIRGQLRNMLRFLDDPVIVLHVSADLDVDVASLGVSDRVLVNPERYSTAWATGILVRVHASNVRYALGRKKCDYVSFHASNELFVRRGVETYMEGHLAGQAPTWSEDWMWRRQCHFDRPLRHYMRQNDLRSAQKGQIEGSFYRRDVFEQMLESLEPLEGRVAWPRLEYESRVRMKWPYLFVNPHYPREEVYFPTALTACGIRPSARPYTYMNWSRQLTLSIAEVDAIRRRDYDALPDEQVATGRELYAVKRVPRASDDPVRLHIERLPADGDPGRV